MKAIISFGMTSGLGDSYGGMYRAYITHEYLKNLGYEITTYVNLGLNPYKMDGNNRDIFKRVFELEKFDNLNIILNEFNSQHELFPKDYELIFDNSGIYQAYVDVKLDIEYNFETYYYWQDSDDLPKYNFLSKEIIDFCEEKIKKFPKNFYIIHYRWYEISDKETTFNNYKDLIFEFLNKNKEIPIFICTTDQDFKDRINEYNYSNVFFNNYNFPENWYTRTYNWEDEKLFEFFKETIFEMYIMSKSEKILRLCPWFSGFLFFSNSNNQTNISNKLRYFPPFR